MDFIYLKPGLSGKDGGPSELTSIRSFKEPIPNQE